MCLFGAHMMFRDKKKQVKYRQVQQTNGSAIGNGRANVLFAHDNERC